VGSTMSTMLREQGKGHRRPSVGIAVLPMEIYDAAKVRPGQCLMRFLWLPLFSLAPLAFILIRFPVLAAGKNRPWPSSYSCQMFV